MTKEIKVTKNYKAYIVKLNKETVNNVIGISIRVFYDNENVMKHFLDFSEYTYEEIEKNIIKFTNCFNEKEALRWIDGYLEGKR